MKHSLTVNEMHQICRRRKLTKFSKLRKQALRAFIKKHIRLSAAIKIQRQYKRHRSLNTHDVFSGDPLNWNNPQRLILLGKHTFDVRTLLEYMLISGKFQNPYTRVQFTDDELLKLQRLFFKHDTSSPLTYRLEQNDPVLIVDPASFEILVVKKIIIQTRLEQTARVQTIGLLMGECTNTIHLISVGFDALNIHRMEADERETLITNLNEDWFPTLVEQYTNLFQISPVHASDIRSKFIINIYNRFTSSSQNSSLRCILRKFSKYIINLFIALLRAKTQPDVLCQYSIQADLLDKILFIISKS